MVLRCVPPGHRPDSVDGSSVVLHTVLRKTFGHQFLNLLITELTSDHSLTLEQCRLVTGAIQLAEGTHLTLDETALQTGTLGTIGVQNLEVLKHLLQWQKVRSPSCNFVF